MYVQKIYRWYDNIELVITTTLQGKFYYYLHFTDKEVIAAMGMNSRLKNKD